MSCSKRVFAVDKGKNLPQDLSIQKGEVGEWVAEEALSRAAGFNLLYLAIIYTVCVCVRVCGCLKG